MDERPPDFIPPTPPTIKVGIYTVPATRPSPAPARRGGRRPGAGARPGNLNALKHGRYSRFKNTLPPEPFDPAVAARSILLQQRTEAERIAASFFRIVLEARWHRAAADALADGRPLPPPPLVVASAGDHARVLRFLRSSQTVTRLDRAAAESSTTLNTEAIEAYRRRAQHLDEILPVVGHLLDRAAAPTATPHALGALLRNEIGFDQPTTLPAESSARALAAIAESIAPPTTKNDSINPTTPTATTPKPRNKVQRKRNAQASASNRHRQRTVPSRSGMSGSPPSRSGGGTGGEGTNHP